MKSYVVIDSGLYGRHATKVENLSSILESGLTRGNKPSGYGTSKPSHEGIYFFVKQNNSVIGEFESLNKHFAVIDFVIPAEYCDKIIEDEDSGQSNFLSSIKTYGTACYLGDIPVEWFKQIKFYKGESDEEVN